MAIRHRYFTGIPNDTRYEDDSDPSIKSPDDFGWYYPGYHFVCWKNVTNEEEVMPGDLYGGGSFNAIWEKSVVNKVIVGTETLVDLTQDTVSPSTLQLGMTAHDASGRVITGTMDTYTKNEIDDLLDGKADSDDYIVNGTTDPVSFGGDVTMPVNGLLKVARATVFSSVSIAAKGNKSDTYTIKTSDIGEGWTAIAVVGYSMGQQTFNVYRLRLAVNSTDTIEYSVYNADTSAHTGSLGVMLLCVRTG